MSGMSSVQRHQGGPPPKQIEISSIIVGGNNLSWEDTYITLRADRFFSSLVAEFEPLAFHVSRTLEVKQRVENS